jgi:hypothetical protein
MDDPLRIAVKSICSVSELSFKEINLPNPPNTLHRRNVVVRLPFK